ncbi:MAG: glycosyltransferase family 2 protein [Planctomycetota bacterium]
MPVVSIVVPTFRRSALLARCLASIRETVRVDHEVICVGVAGDDATAREATGARARLIVEPERGGFVRATNLGFRAARGEWLLQLNDDCRLLPHSVENAVRFMSAPAHARIGQAAFFHDTPVSRNVHSEVSLDGRVFRTLHVRGLCYANFGLVRRTLSERLGHLDERYFMYGADPDFSLKIWHEAGLEVAPCPGALVEHEEVVDERAETERPSQRRDNALLFEKWGMEPRVAEAVR